MLSPPHQSCLAASPQKVTQCLSVLTVHLCACATTWGDLEVALIYTVPTVI